MGLWLMPQRGNQRGQCSVGGNGEPAQSAAPADSAQVQLKYLGTAGWEISDGKAVVLIDPYLSKYEEPQHRALAKRIFDPLAPQRY